MIRIDVTARQPLHLGVRPDAGWLSDTHRFVPGSVLRGALAASWLADHHGPDPDVSADPLFLRMFEGAVRYGPLYPTPDALRPLSVYGCKYPGTAACHGYVHDAAFDGAVPADCPHCAGTVIASRATIDGAPETAEHTRVELDAHERAADGQLFTRRVLPAGSTLTGLVAGDLDGDLAWLADGDLPLRLGGRRSTAGLAVLRARTEPPPTSFTGWSDDRTRLVVRLLAPGIFVDGHGRPSWLPDVHALRTVLGVVPVIEAVWTRPTVVSGWHAASNLPKPQDFAVAAGSVFVLRFDAGPPEPAGVERLWRNGIGLRRAEGNGWVALQRWTPPAAAVPIAPSPLAEADELFLTLVAGGAAALVMNDLRAWAQDAAVGAVTDDDLDAVLGQRRYEQLSPAVREALRRALALDSADAVALARRLDDHDRAATRRRAGEQT